VNAARLCTVAALAVALTACNGSSKPGTAIVDASHPPAPVANGQQAAPPDLAAPLLTPADLGPTWSAVEAPAIGLRTPPAIDVGPAPVYEVRSNLQTQHWNGTAWVPDQNLQELATSYGTPAKASHELSLQILQGRGDCGQCPLAYSPEKVSGIKVWRFDSKKAAGSGQALFTIGPLFIRLTISAPTSTEAGIVSADDAIRLAVTRAKAEPEPQ
jgi:hypothetical protein